ncbi:MAG: efflux transporter outer membrane subunit [Pirellulaceae bacterium]|nr:efflux transporter outer membrane subunit [Pirellulaceae bacterium]
MPCRVGIVLGFVVLLSGLSGCTSTRQWWHNGFKVGPNYGRPATPVASAWLDGADPSLRPGEADYSAWWTVFRDPVLDRLVTSACEQNLPLQSAGWRILEARAQRGMAAGSLWPQSQRMTGTYSRSKFSDNMYPFGQFPGNREFDDWGVGFDMAWELDLWGRFRRGIEAADAHLEAQVEDYDDVLVILQAEVAATYVQLRTIEEQLVYTRNNVALQRGALEIIERRFQEGIVSELDVRQASALLAVTESLVPQFEEARRRMRNTLCLLLGTTPGSLDPLLDQPAAIPAPPPEVVVGIPADLLRRRPDVRRAERQVAAQSARIGVAAAEFYPHLALTGTISFQAEQFSDLFRWSSLGGRVGPGLQWNILNYGRILNHVRAQDARFQQEALAYQQSVLAAHREAEDAITGYLREQQRVKFLRQAVADVTRSLEIGLNLYEQGVIDYQRVLDSQRALVLQDDALAQSQGKVAINLVAVYKALGGGWQSRLSNSVSAEGAAGAAASQAPSEQQATDVP